MTITLTGRKLAVAALLVLAVVAAYVVGSSRPSAAQAAVLTSVPSATGSTDAAPGGITVTGTGSVTGTPDTLRLNLSVSTTAADIDTALGSANTAMHDVIAALRDHGVAEKDLQTSNLSIQPNWTSKGSPDGYAVTESLAATVRDLAKAGSTLTAAVAAGGNAVRVDGVSVALDDTSGLVGGARAKAMADARTKAEQYAQAAGRPLGQVVSVSEQVSGPSPVYYGRDMAVAAGAAVPVQAGTQDVGVSVTVVYAFG